MEFKLKCLALELPTDIIYLDDNSWIKITELPYELKEYTRNNFEELFELHPEERGKIIIFDKDLEVKRWYKSYMKTPCYQNKNKSYMYADSKEEIEAELPTKFQPIMDYLNENESIKYNQCIINWYKDGDDYIAPHSDCEIGMIPNADISIVSINKNGEKGLFRDFVIKSKHFSSEQKYHKITIKMRHGYVITMSGDMQKNYTHSIPVTFDDVSPRIGITFRKII